MTWGSPEYAALLPFPTGVGQVSTDIALDIGTTTFRCLRRENGQLVARQEAAVYTVVPKCREARKLLTDAGIPFSGSASGLVVAGQAAVHVAYSFETPVVPLLPGGELPTSDPVARQVSAMLLEAVLGRRDALAGRLCLMTVPGSPGQGEPTGSLLFFTRVVALAGLRPQVVHAGSAVAASAFADRGLRGIGVSFGASHVDVGIIVQGFEKDWHRVPIGGDTIDAKLIKHHAAYLHDRHGDRFPDYLMVRRWKQSMHRSLLHDDATSRTLAAGYADVAISAAEAVADLLAKDRQRGPRRPYGLVATGGPTRIEGFKPLWEQALRRTRVLGQLEDAIVVNECDYEVARGLLLLTEAGSRAAAA